MIVHKHWILSIRQLALPVLALLGTWGILYFLPVRMIALSIMIVDIGISVWLLRNYLDYYLDALLITDRAVIDVEWHGWFHRRSTRIDYSAIEGISYEIEGILGTIFHFGTVTIERIGEGSIVEIENVKKPRDIESAVLACQTECLRAKNLKDSSAVKDIIAEIVAERIQMEDLEEEYEKNEEEVYV